MPARPRTAFTSSRRAALAALAALAAFALAEPAAAEPAVPTFVDGQAQPVFGASSTWIRQELWVEAQIDSDFDGKLDRIHIDVTRVQETETDALKVPVVLEASPYYAGAANVINWAVDHEIGAPPATRPLVGRTIRNTSPKISTAHESTWVPRGFAVVHVEGIGSGLSEGCPSVGGVGETIAPKAVVDWLNGRAKGYASPTSDVEVSAYWSTGSVGMIGTSYNGTLPIAVATTGVEGLDAIVPISAISSWYDYYRANGMVRAPGGFQGEDTDVLGEYVYSRPDRVICAWAIDNLRILQDRVTGDYSPFWDERNYMNDIDKVRAASLVAHGNNDWNVMTKHAAVYYEAVKARGVPHQLYWHQGGHGGSPPTVMLNRWFTRYLWKVANGVEDLPKAWVVREGQSSQSPTPYPEWPDPDAAGATLGFASPGLEVGTLSFATPTPALETLVDNAGSNASTFFNAASSPNRLVFKTAPLSTAVRISGTPTISLDVSFSKPKANLTALLVSYPGTTGSGTVITRGWIDPENRTSPALTEAVVPGTIYRLRFDLQPKDSVIAAGRRLGLVIISSDREYTVRPAPGTELTVDLAASSVTLPVVGGGKALGEATGVSAPTIAYELDPAAPTGDDGWYDGDVTLDWQLADGGAALTTAGCVDEDFADGEFTRSCSTSNVVGAAGPVSVSVKRDATAPEVEVTGVADGAVYVLGAVPAAGCATSDATSGVAADAVLQLAGGPLVGFFTATCANARDEAGNAGSAEAGYQVVYAWSGFGSPIGAGPNERNAGSAVPVKFTLGGDQGLAILAAGSPRFQPTSCATGASSGPSVAATIQGGALNYDAGSGQYHLVWKTERSWDGSCGVLELRLVDGTTRTAAFRF